MEFNIEELRKERRPLWMTSLGLESPADMLGGGGDIHTDRLALIGIAPLVQNSKTWKKTKSSWKVGTSQKTTFHKTARRGSSRAPSNGPENANRSLQPYIMLLN